MALQPILISPSCSRTIMEKNALEHIELEYHDCKNVVMERGLPDWVVRDSAPFEKMKTSGVDKLTSLYTDDFEKLTSKTLETFKDYLTDKEYT
jgi:hypothetical protein